MPTRELDVLHLVGGATPATAAARVNDIGSILRIVLRDAANARTTPHQAAMVRARTLVNAGSVR